MLLPVWQKYFRKIFFVFEKKNIFIRLANTMLPVPVFINFGHVRMHSKISCVCRACQTHLHVQYVRRRLHVEELYSAIYCCIRIAEYMNVHTKTAHTARREILSKYIFQVFIRSRFTAPRATFDAEHAKR